MATITGTSSSEKFDRTGRYIWNGTSWVLLSTSGTTLLADTVSAGAGNDIISGDAGNDVINGENGDDTIYGGLASPNSTGSGADTLRGGAGNDTIYGGDGNDTIDGGDDNDLIFGEAGSDQILSGSGRDVISGGDGSDTIDGGNDDDDISGDAGNDVLKGGLGQDTIHGGDGSDNIDGGDGNDTLFGDAGDDTIKGGLGLDIIHGGDGSDNIDGGDGDDEIYGDAGNDVIKGAAGRDTIQGGDGSDNIDGGSGNDTISGDAGNDVITGNYGLDTIHGNDGDDNIDGGADSDAIFGDAGNDVLKGGSGQDTIQGGDGNDTIDGGIDSDILMGDAGNDKISGGNGNDTLTGGAGADILSGDTGADIYAYNAVSDSAADASFKFNALTGDVIKGFSSAAQTFSAANRDKVDVSGLVSSIGHSLTWGDKTAGAYKIWYEVVGLNTFVSIDTSGDGKADLVIKMEGKEVLSAADFTGLGLADNVAPTVSSVAYGANDGALKAGDTMTLTVTFSEAVLVAGGTPTLSLNSGGVATYTAGSGTSTLIFTYTVAPGENAGDLAVTALNPNTATIKDAAGNSANLSGAAADPTGTVIIDTTEPAAPGVALTADSGTAGDAVTNNGALSLTGVEGGATVEYSTDGGAHWSSSFTPVEGPNTLKIRQIDAAGNASPATDFSFTLDTQAAAPGVALTSDTGTSGDKITSNGALSLSGVEGSAAVEYSTDGGAHWSSSFTPVEGLNEIKVRQTDKAGNTSAATDFSFTLDTQAAAPGVALTSDSGIAGDKITSNGALSLSGVEGGATVEYSTDGGAHWSSSFTPAEGLNEIKVRQTDKAGNVSAATDFSFTLDTQAAAPGVALTTDTGTTGDKITSDGALSLTGTESGAAVEYSTDGGAHWSSSFTPVEGLNEIKVRQTDKAGNVSTATDFSFTLDTQAAAPGVALTSDTGTSGDMITSNGALSLTGVESGAAVEYSTDGGAHWSSSFTPVEGLNEIKVRQADKAGNVSAATDFSFTLDTHAPDAPGVALTSDTGTTDDGITSNGALSLTGTESGAAVEYSTDGGAHWSSSFTPVEGLNEIKVRQTDKAGNVSAATDFSFTLDTHAPDAPGVALTSDTGTTDDGITSNSALSLTAEPDATVEYSIDGGAHWSSSFTPVEGLNEIKVRQTDKAGNVSAATDFSFTLDTQAPAAPLVALSHDSGEAGDKITNDGTLSLGNLEEGATVEYSTDGGAHWSSSFTPTEGANAVKVHQIDAAGNVSATTDLSFTLDTHAPTAPTITGYSDDDGAGDGRTADTTITLTGTAEVGTTVTIYDGGSLIGAATADITGVWTFDTSALDLATHEFTVKTQDVAGNVIDAGTTLTVEIVEGHDGTIVDGYIAGATVFADANDNGVFDAGEASAITDAAGHFTLEGGSGTLIMQGGTDISTGQAFTGTLKAAEGSTTVTPLTTLVLAVAEANGLSTADAQTAVISALGLDPAIGNIGDFDPIAAALSGDPDVAERGAAAAAAAITIQNTIAQGSALLAGAGVDHAGAEAAMLQALASQITIGGDPVDLTNTSTLTSIVTTAATTADATSLEPATIAGAVTVIGAVNDVVAEAAGNSSGADLLTSLAQVQVVVQTEITSTLETAGQTNDTTAAVDNYTGPALQDAVDDAADQVGDIDGGTVGTAGDDTLTGSANADVIDGKAGNDTITGGDGNDTIIGGLGDDTLTGGAGVDTYVWHQGDGNDTILSTGSGGTAEDVIRIDGTFYDYNWELDGNDLIIGVAADDNYNFDDVGGSLRVKDFLTGGDGIAYFEADLGPDNNSYYSPDGGNARIYLSSMTGTDQGNYFELTIGTSGDDVMTDSAGAGQNRLWGGDGNDNISVSGVSGLLVGGNGDDTLTGDGFDDDLRGAAGNDTIDGGGGVDTARYDRPAGSGPITTGVFVNLSDQAATYDFNGSSHTVAAGTALGSYGDTDTLSNIENVRGSNFDDVLIGTSGDNMLRGDGGNDMLVGGDGDDDLQGGDGNDTLMGGAGADFLHGGAGDDVIYGGGNTGSLGENIDFLYGEGGANSFVFGTETGETHIEDFVVGTDVLRFEGDVGIASMEVQDWDPPFGPTTIITLTTGATIALVSVSGITDVAQLLAPAITGTTGPDTLDGTAFADTIIGGEGDDTLTGNAGRDTYVWHQGDGYDTIIATDNASEDVIRIEGTFYDFDWQYSGNDLLVGVVADDSYDFATTGGSLRLKDFFLGGNDSIDYIDVDTGPDNNGFYSPGGGNAHIHVSLLNGEDQGNNFEVILGTDGNDVMTDAGGEGWNQFHGRDGDDTITMAAGSRGSLNGGNGDDILTGAEFDDQLRGSAGNDTMDGGGGNDTVRYNGLDGSPAISSGVFVNLSDNNAATYDFNGSSHTVAAGQALDSWGDTDTLLNIENARGTNFDDILVGTSGANTLRGDGGNDILIAGGNSGSEGENIDFLYGGSGSDSFVFGTETGETHIEDFVVGTDVLRFTNGVSIASMEEQTWDEPWGPTTVITLTTGATIALVSVAGISDAAQLLAPAITGTDDPDSLTGTDFDDTLVGGLGNDTLAGGAGVDTYVWHQGDGYDTIITTDNASQDVIRIEGTFYDYNWVIDGDDLIVGVTADDSYDFATAGGSLRIQNFFAGGDGIAYLEADLGADNNSFFSPGGGNARISFSAVTGTDQGDHFELTIGTSGNDVMTDSAGTGQNRLWGGDGDDNISVHGVAGVLIGGNGDDTLTGAEFDDELRGAAGNDTIDGGGGVDTARYDRPAGSGPITTGAFVNLSDHAATYDFNGSSHTVAAGTALGSYGDTDTLSNIENVRGTNFDDVLVGTSGANTLRGDGGNDIIVGGGNSGFEGVDADYLYGGNGADTFVFGTETGETHIEDFVVGTDVLRLEGGVGIASMEVQTWDEPWGPTTVITLTTGATIALVSVTGITDAAQLLTPPITGTSGPDTLDGTQFDDTLVGGEGDDTLTGNAGHDTYVWHQGDGYDTIIATDNASEDVIRIEGTFYDFDWQYDGNDVLVGVVADDSYDFATTGGSLRLKDFSLGGHDSIDYIDVDAGPDNNAFYSPDGGNARIHMSFMNGEDQGNYFEVILGTNGDDVMTDVGGEGWNQFHGRGGNDTITMAAGSRGSLNGGTGDDILTGAEFDDQLRGSSGNDTLDGGGGNDTVRYNGLDGSPEMTSGAFVNLSDHAATYDFNHTATTIAAGTAIDSWGGTDTLINIESARGTNFDDVLVGTSGANTLRGDGGNDILVAGGNSGSEGVDIDFLYGGGGSDSFVFGTETGETHIEDFVVGTDVLRFEGDVGIASMEEQTWDEPWGPTTVITLTTGATIALVSVAGISDAAQLLAPAITGTTGPDALDGTQFNDTLVGGLGDDTLTGKAGVDTYVWNANDGNDTIISTGSGGVSEDVIRIEGSFYDYNWSIDGDDLIVGVTADDSYDFATVGGSLRIQNFFAGGDSIAYLEADLGADNNGFFSPGGGNARISFSTMTGTDQGNHFELTIGTSGNDVMTDSAGTGQNRLWGGDGDDNISVTGVAGVLIGGNGDDTLTGAEFDDELRGAAGNDTIDGGGGSDIVRYDRPAGSGPITTGAFVNLSDHAATYDFNGSSHTVAAGTALGSYGDTDTLSNIENVRGTNFDDVLVGTSGANTLRGDGGNDIIVGGGNSGFEGVDADYLYGGNGADTFVFGTETGETHIEDFVVGTDVLRFEGDVGIASMEEQTWEEPWGPTTVITLTTGATIALVSVAGIGDAAQLLAPPITGTTDPDALTGTQFNDTLVGGQGDDTLTGGAGVDTYVWHQGDGYDTIVSGSTSEDVIRIEGTFYDYNWEISGNDLVIGAVADDNYDFNDVGGSLRIKDFFAGGDGIAYFEADLGPDNNSYYSPDGGNARLYLSSMTGTDQGNYFELTIGTSGDDVMTDSAGAGRNRLWGGDGNDHISVSGVAGLLVGGNGDDTLTGDGFDDDLRGAAGNDTIDGGGGVDTARYDRPAGSGPITTGAFVNLSDQAATYDFNGSSHMVAAGTALGSYGDTDTLSNIENVRGTNFDDVLIGTSGDNMLRGDGGNDTLVGGGGNDWLVGGGGADSFVFAADLGDDTIEDFQVGTDHIDLQGAVTIATFTEFDSDADTFVDSSLATLSTGATIALNGVTGVADYHDLLA